MSHGGYNPQSQYTYREVFNSRLLFGIIHLSDFHLRKQTEFQTDTMLYDLILDVKERINSLGLSPVYVIITGDLTYSGKKEEFEYAKEFIKLIKDFVDPADIFIAPGNHDVDWKSMRQLSRDIMEKIAEQGKPGIEEASKVFENEIERNELLQGMSNYYDFIKSVYGAPPRKDYLYRVKSINIDPYIVNFISLNSAFLFSPKYSFFGYLGKEQLDRAFLEVANNSRNNRRKEINIAFFHHPFEALPDVTRVETHNLLLSRSDLILTGHVHTPHLITDYTAYMSGRNRSMDPPVFTSARCVFDPADDPYIVPGYYMIGVYADNTQVKEIRVWEIRYGKGPQVWNVDQGYRSYPVEIRMIPQPTYNVSDQLPPGWRYQYIDYESFYNKEAIYKLKFKDKEQINLPFYVFFPPDPTPLSIDMVECHQREGGKYWYPISMNPPFERRKKELLTLYTNYYKHRQFEESLASADTITWDPVVHKLGVWFKQCSSSDALLSDLECDILFKGWKETSREILRTRLNSDSWGHAVGSIGISSLVETKDGKVIVQRKPTFEEERKSGEGFYVHALGGKYSPSSTGGMKYSDENVFNAMYRELEEELFLIRSDIDSLSLMGVTKSVEWNNRPEFHFIAKTNLEEHDIRERSPRDAFEYRNLMFVKRDDKETFYNILSDKETRAARKATFVFYISFFHQDWLETP